MQEILQNVFLVPFEFSLGFSYLIRRAEGNLLIPNALYAENMSDLIESLDRLGGVASILACCKHNVKAKSAAAALSQHYAAPLFIGAPDAEGRMITQGTHVRGLPMRDTAIEHDLQFLPLVGYTDGSGGYLWRDDDRRLLFTGVTLTRTPDEWKVWTSKARSQKCIAGFQRMSEINFDVLFINSYSNAAPAWFEWTPDQKTAVLNEAIAKVQTL